MGLQITKITQKTKNYINNYGNTGRSKKYTERLNYQEMLNYGEI